MDFPPAIHSGCLVQQSPEVELDGAISRIKTIDCDTEIEMLKMRYFLAARELGEFALRHLRIGHMQLSPELFLEAFQMVDEANMHPQVMYAHIALACMLELNRSNAMEANISTLQLNKLESLGRAIAQACLEEHTWPTEPIGREAVYKATENFNLQGGL
jgi:hypothetical protein